MRRTPSCGLVAIGSPATPYWYGKELHEDLLLAHQARAGVLCRLALWAGDDGLGEAYWLAKGEGAWFLERPGQESVACFASIRDRPDGTLAYVIPDLDEVRDHDEALRLILTHIEVDRMLREHLMWNPQPGTLARLYLFDAKAGEWLLLDREHPPAHSHWAGRLRSHLFSPHPSPEGVSNFTQIPDFDPQDPAQAWAQIAVYTRNGAPT